jgi:hypothetical protein
MELNIITGNFANKWWAETTNLPKNFGVELTNSTEQEAIITLVKSYFTRKNNNGEPIPEEHKELMVSLSEGTQSQG